MKSVRRTVEIEALLRWAYQDELPKLRTSSAEGIWERIGGLGAGMDLNQRTHTSANRYPHFGLPHDDAIAIEKAVDRLGRATIDWDQSGPDLMADMVELFQAHREPGDYKLLHTYDAAMLVRQHAIMGTRPPWQTERLMPARVLNERGPRVPKVVGEWSDGRWKAGAYCPLRWAAASGNPVIGDLSPIGIALRRGTYAVWHDGLRRLAEMLSGAFALDDHVPLPPDAPSRPWLVPARPRAILSAGAPMLPPMSPLHPRRQTAVTYRKLRLGGAVPAGGVP